MAEAVRFGRRKELARREEERRQLMEGMRETRNQLNCAYAQFNAYSDPDLVDSCVYQINALQSRYSYFLRQMKLLDAAQEEAV
ncbi:MAG: YaaL family protein [Oscillospiraceae bacterium]|nr:YaaL family protein [Oscillospiraceae bacterium]MDE7170954.1 YaaL family protein [Oscillospiraceae bacterium]